MRLVTVITLMIVFSVSAQVPAVYNNTIQKTAENMMNEPALKHASLSFYVYDLDSNKVLADYDGEKSLVPASTMKLVTTATALQLLGSYHKFKTYLEYDGYIDTVNRVLKGNIYVKGGGDPTLGSKYFSKTKDVFKQDWYDAIGELGIDKIEGSVIADASWYTDDMVPTTWIWGDIANYFAAGPNGLTVYDNTYYLDFKSGENAGDSTEIQCIRPYIPEMIVENRVKAAKIRNDQAYIFGAPYDPYKIVQGRIPLAKESFEVKGAIADPAYQVAWELNWMLKDSGMVVTNQPTTVRRMKRMGSYLEVERIRFHTHKSPALSKIVYWTNLLSINLYAEHLLRAVAKKKYSDGSNFSGTIAVQKYWKSKGVNTSGLYVNDGSGLSRHNAISAQHLVGILKVMNTSKYAKTFKSSLPIAGKTGTLKSMCRGTSAQGNLRAKSGTMSRIKSYAGYVKTKSGRHLAFAMIVNNHTCTHSVLKKKLEKIMVAMSGYNQ